MTQRRRRAPQTRRVAPAEFARGIGTSEDYAAGRDPENVPEPGGLPTVARPAQQVEVTIKTDTSPAEAAGEKIAQSLEALRPRMRLVRFRFGWGYGDTAPAIVFDEQIAVLLPPKTPIAPGAQLTFRAPDGGWSMGKARPGDGIGEYQEV